VLSLLLSSPLTFLCAFFDGFQYPEWVFPLKLDSRVPHRLVHIHDLPLMEISLVERLLYSPEVIYQHQMHKLKYNNSII